MKAVECFLVAEELRVYNLYQIRNCKAFQLNLNHPKSLIKLSVWLVTFDERITNISDVAAICPVRPTRTLNLLPPVVVDESL